MHMSQQHVLTATVCTHAGGLVDAHSIRVWTLSLLIDLQSTNEIASTETNDTNRPSLCHSIDSVVCDNYVAMEVDEELLLQLLLQGQFTPRFRVPISSQDFVQVSVGRRLQSLIDSWTKKRKTWTDKTDPAKAEEGGQT